MHIEFKLPRSAGGVNTLYTSSTLHRELNRWCKLYGYEYSVEITETRVQVEFTDRSAYTLFLLGAAQHFTAKWHYEK